MDKSISSWKKHLTYLLCGLINIQPVLANVVVSGTKTTITAAGNGVEVVNIAAPNSKGLSHNQYDQFNVDKNGLILNNSTEKLSQSQLGGLLQNNPNLTGQSASVILNEVTGANRSQLQGYTEVHGASANVILANPYGITCDGCGFINTPRVTLSTGTPEFANGEVSGFDVSQGSVTVEGLGLDASNQTYFDIISRTAKINAELHANDLAIITGQNKVDYQTNTVTKKASDSDSKPALAIDSSSLGGMYAGRISLVATEEGVGVNVGNLAASQGDIQITADGKIVMGKTSSASSLVATTSNTLEVTADQSASNNITLQGDVIALSGSKLSADDDITVTGQSVTVTNSSLVSGNALSVTSDSVVLKNAAAEAAQLAAEVNHISLDSGSRITSQSANLTKLAHLDNQGDISVSGLMTLQGDNLQLTGAGDMATAALTANAQNIMIETHAQVQEATLSATDKLVIGSQAELDVSNRASLSAKAITQDGRVTANQTIQFQADDTLDHSGSTHGKVVTVATGELNQTGQLTAYQNLTINSDSALLAGETSAGQHLTVVTDALTVNGKVQSSDTLSLIGKSSLNSGASSDILSGTDMQLSGEQITLLGTTQSAGGVNIDGQHSVLNGAVSAQKTVTISGATLSQEGTLAAGESLTLNQSDSIALNGTVEAATDLTATTQDFASNLKLVSGGDMVVNAKETAIGGVVSSKGDLTITSATLSQTGQTVAQGDITFTTDNSTIAGSVASGKSLSLTANNALTSNSTAKLSSDEALSINTGTFVHQGDSNSRGNTQITAHGLNNQGALKSNQNLSLAITTLNHQGELSANGNLNLTVNNALVLSNDITSGGNLTLTATSLDNRANINSANQTQVTLTGGLTNQSSGVISGNNTQINANTISNSGTLQALNALTLTTTSLTNPGALIALGNLVANVSGTFTNTGLVYAGNNADLFVNVLNNFSDILTQNHLTIARNAAKQKSSSLLNSSATIESLGGDISIYANTVTNKRTQLIDTANSKTDYVSQIPGGGGSIFTVGGSSAYTPSYEYFTQCFMWCGPHDLPNPIYHSLVNVKSGDKHTFIAFEEGNILISASASSKINGRNVDFSANSIINDASQISGDSININASTLVNKGYSYNQYTTYYDYQLSADNYTFYVPGIAPPQFEFVRTNIRKVKTGNSDTLHSSITATGNVSLNVANKVNNSTIQSNAARVAPTGSSKTTKATNTASVSGPATVNAFSVSALIEPSITLPTLNSVPFPDFRLPSSPNGLFIYTNGPQSGYLIETNPALTNLGNFLGSDYFMGNVGFNPEQDITFLGDAFYDTRIITQAIFEQTGKRYLTDSVGSDTSQMKALMDAAANEKNTLDLKMGIALSAEQVTNLTQDILWYEQIEVNGQSVLAPKLYLSQVTEENISSGAVIAGRDIEINAGEIENSGSILASNTLDLKSDARILNDTGTLSGGGNVALASVGDIENISGTIAGDDVSITSTQGSFINKTLSEQLSVDDDGNWLDIHSDESQITRTYMGDTAIVKGENSVSITAGNSIVSTGAAVESGGDASLKAMNVIVLDTVQTQTHTDVDGRHKQTVSSDTNYVDSRVTGKGNVTLQSGGNLVASGGTVEADESLTIQAGGDVILLANETNRYRADVTSRKKEIERQTRQEGTTLSAGNALSITTGGDANFVASTVKSGDNLNIQTGGELTAVAAQESDYELHFKKKSGMFGSSTSKTEIQSTTAKGTTFTSGGALSLISQSNQNHQASELTATDNIHIESTQGELAFTAAEESDSYRHETKKSGVMVKMKGKGDTSTTQKLTSMQSGGDITLASALGIKVDYVSTDGQLGKALNELPAGDQYAWMAQLKDNPNVNWNEVNEAFDSWSYSEQSLSGPAAAIIAIAVSVVTAGAGAAVASSIGATSAVSSAAVSAATSTLISQASLSFINNGGDIGATFKDLGSSANSKALLASILTAGALAGYDSVLTSTNSVSETALASGNPSIYTPVPNISVDSVLTQVGRSGIEAGISSTIYDTDFTDSFVNSLRGAIANDIGAFSANEIGDLGLENGWKNGGLEKTALHAVTQGTVAELAGGDFAAGAAAGAVTELAGDFIGNSGLDKEDQVNVSGLIGAGAALVATGDAEGVYTGQTAGGIVHEYNHLNHTEKVELELLKTECNGGNEGACDRRDELNRLDYERDKLLQTACSVGAPDECGAQIKLALESYMSYEEEVTPYDDIAIGQERESIAVILKDPDGSIRQADQEYIYTISESIPYICTLMSFGACASVGGSITIAVDGLGTYLDYHDNKSVEAEYGSSNVIMGIIGAGVDAQLDNFSSKKFRYVGKVINATYGKVVSEMADNAVEMENKIEKN